MNVTRKLRQRKVLDLYYCAMSHRHLLEQVSLVSCRVRSVAVRMHPCPFLETPLDYVASSLQ